MVSQSVEQVVAIERAEVHTTDDHGAVDLNHTLVAIDVVEFHLNL